MTEAEGKTLRVQSVLYNTDIESLKYTYLSLAKAARILKLHGLVERVEMAYGDCSPTSILGNARVLEWQKELPEEDHVPFDIHFFGANLGSAKGHNTLMKHTSGPLAPDGEGGYVAIMNPDVKLSGDTLLNLMLTLLRPQVGIVEARQLPIEHPKHYDEKTGITSWVSTALAMTTSDIFWSISGFDADTFFLYCDDVDFSWRIREQGHLAVFQPAATIFHDKQLSSEGEWQVSSPEVYYSAEGALMLTHKWSRTDLTEKYLAYFENAEDPQLNKVAKAFKERREAKTLPEPRDKDHKIGQFVGLEYAKHRF